MILSEILHEMGELVARQVVHNIPLDKFKDFTTVGSMNRYNILKSAEWEHLVLYKLTTDESEDICYLVGIIFNDGMNENIQIKRTWMNEKYRNQGIMTQFYKKLFKDFHINLISDDGLSPESKRIWYKLFQLYPNQMFLTTKDLQRFDKLDSIDDYFRSDKFLLTLRHDGPKLESKIPFNIFQKILCEYQLGVDAPD